jgi:hypothetical protein
MRVALNLGFINDDVNAQLTRSRQIIEAADKLRGVLSLVQDEQAKKTIEDQIRALVDAAKGLTINATTTSTNAASLLIVSSSKS